MPAPRQWGHPTGGAVRKFWAETSEAGSTPWAARTAARGLCGKNWDTQNALFLSICQGSAVLPGGKEADISTATHVILLLHWVAVKTSKLSCGSLLCLAQTGCRTVRAAAFRLSVRLGEESQREKEVSQTIHHVGGPVGGASPTMAPLSPPLRRRIFPASFCSCRIWDSGTLSNLSKITCPSVTRPGFKWSPAYLSGWKVSHMFQETP